MTIDETRARRLILVAAAVALVARLGFGFTYWVNKPLTHDEHEYLALARGIASGHGFVYDELHEAGTAQRFGRAPGYPVFLAALDAGRPLPTSTPSRVKIAQAVIGAWTVWLLGAIATRAAGPASGVWAAYIASIYPPLVALPAYALSETLYSSVALAAAAVLQTAVDRSESHDRRSSALWAIAAGALVGTSALIRPAMLLFLPLACGWLIARRRGVVAVALAVTAVAVIAPWTLRNSRVHDRFVLIASEGGVTFWTGNHPLARGEGDLAANPELKRAELAFRAARPGLSPEQLEPRYYGEALSWIREHPVDWATLLVRKAFYSIVPVGPSYAVHSARYRVVSIAPYVIVFPFAVVGLVRLWRSPRRPTALLLLAASSILVGLLFFPQERFRMPVIDPMLIVSAATLAGRPRS